MKSSQTRWPSAFGQASCIFVSAMISLLSLLGGVNWSIVIETKTHEATLIERTESLILWWVQIIDGILNYRDALAYVWWVQTPDGIIKEMLLEHLKRCLGLLKTPVQGQKQGACVGWPRWMVGLCIPQCKTNGRCSSTCAIEIPSTSLWLAEDLNLIPTC